MESKQCAGVDGPLTPSEAIYWAETMGNAKKYGPSHSQFVVVGILLGAALEQDIFSNQDALIQRNLMESRVNERKKEEEKENSGGTPRVPHLLLGIFEWERLNRTNRMMDWCETRETMHMGNGALRILHTTTDSLTGGNSIRTRRG